MDNPKSRSDRDWRPDIDDDNDYEYRDGYWHVYYDEHDELTVEEEDAAERSYIRSQKRAEWDHYHPSESCPECELDQ